MPKAEITHYKYIKQTLEMAYDNIQAGGRPFAAIIVHNDVVIATACNEINHSHNPIDHAEFLALKRAFKALKKPDLSQCTLYASGQPCNFCLAAMSLYGITRAYYGYSSTDWRSVATPLPLSNVNTMELNPNDGAQLYHYWQKHNQKQ